MAYTLCICRMHNKHGSSHQFLIINGVNKASIQTYPTLQIKCLNFTILNVRKSMADINRNFSFKKKKEKKEKMYENRKNCKDFVPVWQRADSFIPIRNNISTAVNRNKPSLFPKLL